VFWCFKHNIRYSLQASNQKMLAAVRHNGVVQQYMQASQLLQRTSSQQWRTVLAAICLLTADLVRWAEVAAKAAPGVGGIIANTMKPLHVFLSVVSCEPCLFRRAGAVRQEQQGRVLGK
jgi:hypothetical protein